MPYDKDEIRPELQALYDALDPKKLKELDHAIAQWRGQPTALLHVVHAAQEAFTWVPEGAMERIARGLDIPKAEVYGFVTFYDHFYTDGPARHAVRICQSISCYLRGSNDLIAAASKHLGVQPGARTKDERIRFECVSCLGQCDNAPSVSIDDIPQQGLSAAQLTAALDKLK
ncbi:MAG: NAD(P)H-dependent oxidoreductase subunit E [Planctomycetes bacterium]|nr:NAD(P)H-dependent oxidoreductase subunit E [Planctomycetota bacterium]